MSEQNEIGKSIARTLFSLINVPLLGPTLNEVFNFRSTLKQNRLNQFTERLENYFSNHAGINLENFKTEEFSDLFESVLKRVVLTKSLEKMRMFTDVLINQLKNPSQSVDESELHLDLISELAEIEIKILFQFRQFIKSFKPQINDLDFLEHNMFVLENKMDNSSNVDNSDLLDLQTQIGKKRRELNRLQNIYKHDHFGISKDQFLFYKQRLFSKGLLIDNGIGSIGSKPFDTMGVTQFGINFIDYIMVSS